MAIAGSIPGDLIGRDVELATIGEAIAAHPLVTLTGPGGTGKTSLAMAMASRVDAAGGPAGLATAATIDLAAVDDPGTVPAIVAGALGARERHDGDLEAALAERLASTPTLVVLDNLEHLLAAAPFVAWLAAHAGPSRVLTTSRAALNVAIEHVVPIEPLAVPAGADEVEQAAAGALFLRRAGRAAGGLDRSDLVAIARICAGLDGLPLAIELAAAWSSILSPRAIARRLDDGRLPLASDRDDRHASLVRVIESSLELVGERERQAFDQLAVFAGSFDDGAASEVIGPDSLSVVRSLASLSLVQVAADAAGEPRFRLLETVRAIARARLQRDPDAARAAALAHARTFERRAAVATAQLRHQGFSDPEAAAILADPNIAASLEFAMAIRDAELAVPLATWPMTLAVSTGLFSPAIRRLQEALALGPISPGVRADALNALVASRVGMGEGGAELVGLVQDAIAAAREIDDPRRLSRALVTYGHLLPHEVAIVQYQAGAEAAASAGYDWMVANSNLNIAWRQLQLGRYRESIASSERAVAAALAAESPMTVADARISLADAWLALGEETRAAEAYEAVLPELRGRVAGQFSSAPVHSLAILAVRRGDRDAAMAWLAELVDMTRDSESADARNDLAVVAAIVLADRHPEVAAHGLGLERRDLSMFAIARDIDQARSITERRLGTRAAEHAIRRGAAAGPAALAAEVRRILEAEGPESRRRLRAAYEAFTPREEQVLSYLADGRSDPDIAAALGISTKTASVHVANIKAKLGLDSRVAAALEARRLIDRIEAA